MQAAPNEQAAEMETFGERPLALRFFRKRGATQTNPSSFLRTLALARPSS
jgi:hypothetical protein